MKRITRYASRITASLLALAMLVGLMPAPSAAAATHFPTGESTGLFAAHTCVYNSAAKYEAAHPHREYKNCSCGAYQYTGSNKSANWGATTYSSTHPHTGTQKCTVYASCSYTRTATFPGSTYSGCATCNPPAHTHTWTTRHEAAHPHFEYKTCSCGATEYTGANKNGNWGAATYSSTHPHTGTQKCIAFAACTYTISANYSGKYSGCTTCNPHVHSYGSVQYEAAHPHFEYRSCSCGATEYTGANKNGIWGAATYSSTHPHTGTQKCIAFAACTYTISAGYSGKYSGCTTCNPPAHTHAWTTQYEADHPHKGFRTCSCGAKEYTGSNKAQKWLAGTVSVLHPNHNRVDRCDAVAGCSTTDTVATKYHASCTTCVPPFAFEQTAVTIYANEEATLKTKNGAFQAVSWKIVEKTSPTCGISANYTTQEATFTGAPGTYKIEATCGGVSAYCTVTVVQKASIQIVATESSVYIGSTISLTARNATTGSLVNATWSQLGATGGGSVSTTLVGGQLKVTGKTAGTVTLKATYVENGVQCTDEFVLTVKSGQKTLILDEFEQNEDDIEETLKELDTFLNDYLESISPPRYCGNVEINKNNKSSYSSNGENIYKFLYDWYSAHIWPYEMNHPRWYNSAHDPFTAEGTKRAALDEWSQKVYGETVWEKIVNGFQNCIDSLYYELMDLGNSLTSAFRQVALGNYTNDVTIIGSTGQIVLSFSGLDFVADVRDVSYDLTHWEWKWSHAGQTAIDLVSILPFIGAIKGLDDVSRAMKQADSLADLTRNADELALLQKRINEYVELAKKSGKFDDLAKQTEVWAKVASNNNNSNIVLLGKFEHINGQELATSYNKVAQANGFSYYSMSNDIWYSLQDVVGKDGMWNINKLYIDQQLAKGKTFLFSHNPAIHFDLSSDYSKELKYLLMRQGLSESAEHFEEYGDLWRIKK